MKLPVWYPLPPAHRPHTAAGAIAFILAPFMIGGAIAFIAASCTPAARQEASRDVSVLAPVLCSVLSTVLGPDGSTAGLVCADVGKALAAGLLLARAGEPSTSVAAVAARTKTCTPLRLVDVDLGRDPREFVCVEAFGGEGAARLAILDALAQGHAR